MIQITAAEATYMREHGFKNMVRKSYTKHPTYYLVEAPRAVNELRKYQNKKIIRER